MVTKIAEQNETEVITTDATVQATIDANNGSGPSVPGDTPEIMAEVIKGVELLPGVVFVKGTRPKPIARGKAAAEFVKDIALWNVFDAMIGDPEGAYPEWVGTNADFSKVLKKNFTEWKANQDAVFQRVIEMKFGTHHETPNLRSIKAEDSQKLVRLFFYISTVNDKVYNKN